ncbi:uncharacterized protein A1O5_11415 [Cladophialophora psammophila CBS 110553]|uniref:Secreted protein n=1 Tax=Cladophialophora psammophila CBS 110553 TaxID=1182543 RepID=W9WZH8_9EURO|nr:uncharacterized protein A1O5_11415 [Cladophialophora psammophila CBS 110553]EXJ63654.1 hypothetical protein A1O5_11415 [Cladophialophora psammophila CBS 110553]
MKNRRSWLVASVSCSLLRTAVEDITAPRVTSTSPKASLLVYCCEPTIRMMSFHGEVELARSGLQCKSDATYEDHLTDFFFAWHNSLLCILNEAVLPPPGIVSVGSVDSLLPPALETPSWP